MKKIVFLGIFLIFAPLTLGISLFTLSQIQVNSFIPNFPVQASASLFAAVPQSTGEVLGEFKAEDARPVIIEKYLQKHKSPLLPYARQLLAAAEKYNVDYRLIVAIAQCESNLCKKAPPNSYNCWGFENGATKFSSWEEAFESVAKTLRTRYLDQGLTTPEQIMPKYAPPSVEKGGPWAKCVRQFIDELEYGKVE